MGRTHDITISGFDLDRIESEAKACKQALRDILAALRNGDPLDVADTKMSAEMLLQRLDSANGERIRGDADALKQRRTPSPSDDAASLSSSSGDSL